MDLKTHMHREMIKHLVQQRITDLIAGDVLDVRTCVVIDDADGDPHAVFSPNGWGQVQRAAAEMGTATLLAPGLSVGKGYADR